jgi:Flp pilus assembly protein TadG
MKNKFGLFSLFWKLTRRRLASSPRLLPRLLRDEDGAYLLYVTLAIPIFIGLAGLATEGALIFYNHRALQSVADAAAYSAAIAYSIDSNANMTAEAEAIVANYGFNVNTDNTNPANNQVSVRIPPGGIQVTNNYQGTGYTAIILTATRPQLPILSSYWVPGFTPTVTATAIISGGAGGGNVRLSVTNYTGAQSA